MWLSCATKCPACMKCKAKGKSSATMNFVVRGLLPVPNSIFTVI